MLKNGFFSYDCEEGFCWHDSLEEAEKSAFENLRAWLNCDPEYHIDATTVCYGKIIGRVERDNDGDYQMEDIKHDT